jgi:hypothetical protein
MPPYVQLAAFVENVDQGSDGVLTLFRVFDRINLALPAGTPPPPGNQDIGIEFTPPRALVLALKRGVDGPDEGGVALVRLVPTAPPVVIAQMSVHFVGGEDAGANLIIRGAPNAPMFLRAGTNWFIVRFNNQELTRIPLTLNLTSG